MYRYVHNKTPSYSPLTVSVVNDVLPRNATASACAPSAPMQLPVSATSRRLHELHGTHVHSNYNTHTLTDQYSPAACSVVSDVLHRSAAANAAIPASPIRFPAIIRCRHTQTCADVRQQCQRVIKSRILHPTHSANIQIEHSDTHSSHLMSSMTFSPSMPLQVLSLRHHQHHCLQ